MDADVYSAIKIVLTGPSGVGKTCLFHRYCSNVILDETRPHYPTTVVGAFSARTIISNGARVILHVWDTAGQERYMSITTMYFRGAKAAIVCFDLSAPNSFQDATRWIPRIRDMELECKIYLCGTKKDLIENGAPRAERRSDILRYAKEIGATFMETSSQTGENVENIFQTIADDYTAAPVNPREIHDVDILDLKKSRTKKKSCCK